MLFRSILTTFILSVVFINKINSQINDIERLSIEFNETALVEALDQINQRAQSLIIYNPVEIPDITINGAFSDADIALILKEILEASSLDFTYYNEHAIIVTKRYRLTNKQNNLSFEILERALAAPDDDNLKSESILNRKFVSGRRGNTKTTNRSTVDILLKDFDSGEPVVGATIAVQETNLHSVTDTEGNVRFNLYAGKYTLIVRHLGFKTIHPTLLVFNDGVVEIDVEPSSIQLGEIVVTAESTHTNVGARQIGMKNIDFEFTEKLPSFLGEIDVLNMVKTEAGVSSPGEGSSGFSVRGGTTDQNLILFDDAIYINPSHAAGFFGSFNGDLIRSMKLYKGTAPPRFGGRVSSVLDIQSKEGDLESSKGKLSISPISFRAYAEGPLFGSKTSYIVGTRGTFSDWVLKASRISDVRNSSIRFYDASIKVSHQFSDKSLISFSSNWANDEFQFSDQFYYDYSTRVFQINYIKTFSNDLFLSATLINNEYKSSQEEYVPSLDSRYEGGLQYQKAKVHGEYTASENNNLDFGLEAINYKVDPGELRPLNESSVRKTETTSEDYAIELSAFMNYEFNIINQLGGSFGLRGTNYLRYGPETIYAYTNEDPVFGSVQDSTTVRKGEVGATYRSLEPRISMVYKFDENTSLKLGYSRMTQYINQYSNLTSASPVSIWQLSNANIQPTRANNYSVGYFSDRSFLFDLSVEFYYRDILNLYDFKDGADLIANDLIEREILNGRGRAYGLELSLRKKLGALTGVLNYTLSRSENKIEGINQFNWYPSNLDQTHNLNITSNYQVNRRKSFSFNFNFNTGRPTIAATGVYEIDGLVTQGFSERNEYRLPSYHRLDVAYTVGNGYKKGRKVRTSWTFSIYNLYFRKNAASLFYRRNSDGLLEPYKFTVLGSAFPSITFNIELN